MNSSPRRIIHPAFASRTGLAFRVRRRLTYVSLPSGDRHSVLPVGIAF